MRNVLRTALSLKTALLLIFAFVASCSPSTGKHSSSSLVNQGILALSTSNPYLGTNLYLAKQAEYSPVLYNFLKNKGGPMAIELIEEGFGPPRMLLFYPGNKEVFAGDLEEINGAYEWIIRGPFSVQRSDYKTIARMDAAMNGEPVFIINGRQERFRFSRALEEPRILKPSPPVALRQPAPKKPAAPKAPPKAPVIKVTEEAPKPPPAPTAAPDPMKDFVPLNSDQQAIQISKGYAERSDNGDAIHTVKSDSETLEAISKWYTGSAGGKAEIEQASNLTAGQPLSKGMRIRIPGLLLKNTKIMPEGYK